MSSAAYESRRAQEDYETILLVSDFHPEEREEKGRKSLRRTIRNSIVWYGEKYGADTLGVGGDIGSDADVRPWFVDEEADAYIADAFDTVKIAIGDGDEEKNGWYKSGAGSLRPELEAQGVEFGKVIEFPSEGDRSYTVRMSHDPKDLNIDWFTTPEQANAWEPPHELDEPQVLLYGHTHTPYARVLRNSVAIGMPSRFKNYPIKGRDEEAGMPDRSLQVLRMGSEHLELYHIDLTKDDENEQLFEYQRFTLEDGGFVEDIRSNVRDIEDRFILPPEYHRLQDEAKQILDAREAQKQRSSAPEVVAD